MMRCFLALLVLYGLTLGACEWLLLVQDRGQVAWMPLLVAVVSYVVLAWLAP